MIPFENSDLFNIYNILNGEKSMVPFQNSDLYQIYELLSGGGSGGGGLCRFLSADNINLTYQNNALIGKDINEILIFSMSIEQISAGNVNFNSGTGTIDFIDSLGNQSIKVFFKI